MKNLNRINESESAPFEIERKFLIEYPDVSWLESLPDCKKYEITQTYFKSGDGEEVRVRKRREDAVCEYFHTVKKKVTHIKRIEIERTISEEEYSQYLTAADPTKRPICKTRYAFPFENFCVEIDVYPFWDDRATLEVELEREDSEICFPNQIKVIKEVTGDPSFKNSVLAKI